MPFVKINEFKLFEWQVKLFAKFCIVSFINSIKTFYIKHDINNY